MKKWVAVLVVVGTIVLLYYMELSMVDTSSIIALPALDNLEIDEAAKEWSSFYKVRVKIIDGQSADFTIPKDLKVKSGENMKLTGAIEFFDSGCRLVEGDKVALKSFFLLPSIGLVEACVIPPSVSMRWTIQVTLAEEMILSYEDMIKTEVEVEGILRIDTSDPYIAAFFLDEAVARII